MNTFLNKPEFINSDPRVNRTYGYTVSAEFMQLRHDIFFNSTNLNGASLLDIGSCVAATGAYVLDHGASFYFGVEYQTDLYNTSIENLTKFYDISRWSVVNSSWENYHGDQKFDIILASGVIYATIDTIGFLKKCVDLADTIIVESVHPKLSVLSYKKDPRPYTKQESFVTIETRDMFYQGQFPGIVYRSAYPSYRYLVDIMSSFSYKEIDLTTDLEKALPQVYNYYSRYAILFTKDKKTTKLGYVENAESM